MDKITRARKMLEERLPCEKERGNDGVSRDRISAGRPSEGEGERRGRIGRIEVCSICENEICAFDLRAGAAVGSITDTAMKK